MFHLIYDGVDQLQDRKRPRNFRNRPEMGTYIENLERRSEQNRILLFKKDYHGVTSSYMRPKVFSEFTGHVRPRRATENLQFRGIFSILNFWKNAKNPSVTSLAVMVFSVPKFISKKLITISDFRVSYTCAAGNCRESVCKFCSLSSRLPIVLALSLWLAACFRKVEWQD